MLYNLAKRLETKKIKLQRPCNFLYADEDVFFCLNSDQCDCANSSFCDPHYKHIITGDLRKNKNNKLRN